MDNTQNIFTRLFFALLPDDTLKEALIKLTHSLKKLPSKHSIGWEKPEKLHITLHFIGKTPVEKIPQLLDTVQQRIALLPAFNVNFTRLVLFPPSSHPHMLALGVKLSMPLLKLVTEITQGVIDFGLHGDKKSYIPHLTLGKLKHLPYLDVRNQRANVSPLYVNQVALLQSISTASGVEYSVVEKLSLMDNKN